jgi:hypothetical protein
MPTPQEQVAQIEAALRRRFFPLVPKIETPERSGWTEDQHDTDRLSRALAAYAIVGLCDIDDAMAVGAITDGKNDGGTRARNHQNVVRGVDFAALDPNQERLRQELALAGITYHYRPSAEARARREDAFTLEEAAVALACLSFPVVHSRDAHTAPRRAHPNAVDLVVTAKKEIGRLWEQDGSHYGQIFMPNLSGLRVCRAVRIFRFIDQILAASERSETSYARRMFFRHGRYFVMAFVAHRVRDVLNRSELALSEADRTTLSQKVNELAEMVFAIAETMRFKGYLSTFRNQTDAQPLADSVLARLAMVDALTTPVSGSQPPQPATIDNASTASSSSGTN